MKGLALAVTLAALSPATLAAKGAPWISVELRPAHGSAGWLVVRTFYHSQAVGYPLSGTAEGLVNGRRVSVPLRFESINVDSESGVFQVPVVWSDGGHWVLNIGLEGGRIGAGAVVGVGAGGKPSFVRFPRAIEGFTRRATRAEVEQLLSALVESREPPQLARAGLFDFARRNPGPVGAMLGLGLCVAWMVSLPVKYAARRLRPAR